MTALYMFIATIGSGLAIVMLGVYGYRRHKASRREEIRQHARQLLQQLRQASLDKTIMIDEKYSLSQRIQDCCQRINVPLHNIGTSTSQLRRLVKPDDPDLLDDTQRRLQAVLSYDNIEAPVAVNVDNLRLVAEPEAAQTADSLGNTVQSIPLPPQSLSAETDISTLLELDHTSRRSKHMTGEEAAILSESQMRLQEAEDEPYFHIELDTSAYEAEQQADQSRMEAMMGMISETIVDLGPTERGDPTEPIVLKDNLEMRLAAKKKAAAAAAAAPNRSMRLGNARKRR